MDPLTKEQALKIAEITSKIYRQGNSWVMEEMDLDTGLSRLTRGLTEKAAKHKLKSWRREKVELLLRATPQASAYTIRSWKEPPHWKGEGIWEWAQSNWYTTREEAEKELDRLSQKLIDRVVEVHEMKTENLPGHFVVS